jgi:hypothetical protein
MICSRRTDHVMASFASLLVRMMLILSIGYSVNIHSLPTNSSEAVVKPTAGIAVKEPIPRRTTNQDCNGHGSGTNSTGCLCDRGWITVGDSNDTAKACSYRQRSKTTAFVLSFILGSAGADWFYLSRNNLGYIMIGILKLLMGCGCCSSWPLKYFGPTSRNSDEGKIKLQYIASCLSLTSIIWWMVDLIRILANKFLDGQGEPLVNW